MTRHLSFLEPFLVLALGPFLVLREWGALPDWTEAAALAGLGGIWMLRRIALGRWSVRTPIDVPVLALVLTIPGAMWAARPGVGHFPAALSRAESLLFSIALAYAIANFVSTRRRAWLAALGILLLGSMVAVLGALTVDWQAESGWPATIAQLLPTATQTVPHATLRSPAHPNQLAGLMAMLIPLAAICAVWPARDRPVFLRVAGAAGLLLFTPLLILTQSRGAIAALVLSMLVIVPPLLERRPEWYGRRVSGVRVTIISLVLVGALAAAMVPGALTIGTGSLDGARPTNGEPADAPSASETDVLGTLRGRLTLWRGNLLRVADRPVTGIGLHNYVWRDANRPDNQGVIIYPGISHSHNLYLQSALDYGVPGAVAVAGLAAALGWSAVRARRRLLGTDLDPLILGAAAGLLAWGLHGSIDAVAIGSKPGFVPWSLAGLVVGIRAHAPQLGKGGDRWVVSSSTT